MYGASLARVARGTRKPSSNETWSLGSMRLWRPGLVLGGGIPLFADAARQDALELVEAKTHKSGVVQLYYEPKKKN